MVEAERAEGGRTSAPKALPAPSDTFIALPLQAAPADNTPIRVEVRRGALMVSVQWPRSAMHECGVWLREVLK
jgi:transposase